ncbi:hypothetical protein Tco_0369330 [Tanacetum coccineum]
MIPSDARTHTTNALHSRQPADSENTNPTRLGQSDPNSPVTTVSTVPNNKPLSLPTMIIFPYLDKKKYEIWAMKMENLIQNADHLFGVLLYKGKIRVRNPCCIHTLSASTPENHMPDFIIMISEGIIWMAVIRLVVTLTRFQKILSQLNQVQVRPDNDDINLKFLKTPSFFVWGTLLVSGSKPTYSEHSVLVAISFSDFGRSDNVLEEWQDKVMNYRQSAIPRFDRRKWMIRLAENTLFVEQLGEGKEMMAGASWLIRADFYLILAAEFAMMGNLSPKCLYSDPVEKEVKPLYSTFVKAGEMHAVPPPITGTYMPSPYQSDIEETQRQVFQTLRPMFSVPYKSKAASVPAGSRNSSASVTADGSDPAVRYRTDPAVNFLSDKTKTY